MAEEHKVDKIINNSYNQGEQTYEDFGQQTMKIHNDVISTYDDQIGENIIENRNLKLLDIDMYAYFLESPWFDKYKKPRRVDSSDRIRMFYYFKEKLSHKNYSNKDIFIAFVEFFQINYEQLYSEIGVLDKELLIKDMNENNQVSHKIKTKRMF